VGPRSLGLQQDRLQVSDRCARRGVIAILNHVAKVGLAIRCAAAVRIARELLLAVKSRIATQIQTCGPFGGYYNRVPCTVGAVAQLVRVPDCRSGGCGFESRRPRFQFSPKSWIVWASGYLVRGGVRSISPATVCLTVFEDNMLELRAENRQRELACTLSDDLLG
jgi:hypothetical protein